ncbi:MAG TPA: acetolactate synthase large subunit [Candidatus Binataceae bacterium]|nr:acetolactate synthase large subunit [Candidatus Binataceae bacterium]
MNGAESLVRTAEACGVTVCFANPGTTEMPLVAALDSSERIRPVLALFEGVCSGAADGYARMADAPAMTLLHLGPGFANSIANFHNARRARSAVLNVIGDHATWHLQYDAPLTADIVSLARPVSGWVRSAASPAALAGDTAEAIAAAGHYPGKVATLIVPANCQWDAADGPATPLPVAQLPAVPAQAIRQAAELMRRKQPTVLFLGGLGLRARSLTAAARIAEKTGCTLMCETFPARMERGAGYPALDRLPYFPEQALEALAPFKQMVIAGAPRPVAFFGYPNSPSVLIPDGCEARIVAEPESDVAAALEALADELGAPARPTIADAARPARPSGPLIAPNIGAALGALIPDNAIVMDEGATTGFSAYVTSAGARPHTYLALTGGAIGQGLPCATGAAVAAPGRKVIALQADGGGMYTLQALWTNAREALDITTVICNNHSYRILQVELSRAGITEPGPKARSLTMLDNPEINWVEMARGMGVPGVRVSSADELVRELERAIPERGPNLIEMMM